MVVGMRICRILIVEDDIAVLDACRRILRHEGMLVRTAENARDALNLVQDEQFDLVLTDLKMPGQDGLALAAAIGKIRPGLPVLAMTGYMPEKTAEQVEELVAGFVPKPFTPDELLSVIRRVLGETGYRE
jgi:DNA-binding NtrC family response regulator